MTTRYEEFVNKEPSLIELAEFIKTNKEMIDEYNDTYRKENKKDMEIDYSVVFEYIKFAKEYGGHYYIGGNIKSYPNDPIKEEYITKARKINIETQPEHMMEVCSQIRCTKHLLNLEKIIELYYEKWLQEYYAPPDINGISGEGYSKIAKETSVGKKIT